MNFDQYLNVAQALGFAAFAIEIVSFSSKHDHRQIVLRAVASLGWVLHYHALGKLVPAIAVGIDFLRYSSAIYIRARPPLIYPAVVVFGTGYLVAALTFQNAAIDLMPGITSVLSCFCVFVLRGIRMRVGFLFVMSSWFVYNIFVHSIGGALNDSVMVMINAITIYRMMRDERKQTA